jgi:hypothetical protein
MSINQGTPRYVTEREVSRIIHRALPTLRNDRCRGQGVPYYKFGRQVRYLIDDVLRYAEANRIETRPL